MPYVILPKSIGKDIDAALAYAWDEQNTLWTEQYQLHYHGVTLSDGLKVRADCYPLYISYLDWKVAKFSPAYASREDAFKSGRFDPREHVIQFMETKDENNAWRDREHSRFASGEYRYTPWNGQDRFQEHFAHLSKNDPTKIAYTKDAEHGVQDRQTIVRVGKYLDEFYRDTFSAEQIADYIACCSAEHHELQIATSASDIREVYVGGPGSCMGGKAGGEQFADWNVHPVEVYGDSDLAVAFYGKRSHVSARAVIWPANKTYSTLYGDVRTLQRMLEDAGYTAGRVDGAKVRAIPYAVNGRVRHDTYYLPYVDGISSASLSRDKRWFYLDNDGEYRTSGIDGYSNGKPQASCDSCGDRYDPNDEGGDGLCDSCYSDQGSCDRCGHRESSYSDDWVHLNSGTYCTDCAERHYSTTCEACDNTWFEEQLSRQTREDRTNRGVTSYCVNCEHGHHICADCDTLIPDSDTHCEDCKPEPEPEAEPTDTSNEADTAILVSASFDQGEMLVDPLTYPAPPAEPTVINVTDPSEGMRCALAETPRYLVAISNPHTYAPYCVCSVCASYRVNGEVR